MNPSTPTLRLDTSSLQPDYFGTEQVSGKSPASSMRARAMSALPALRVSSATTPSAENPPLSPFLAKEAGAGKGKVEMAKALSFQLDQIAGRQRALSVLDPSTSENIRNKRAPSLQSLGKSLSNDITGLVTQEDGDDEDEDGIFSPDSAADLTLNLRNLLLLSLDRGFNLFDEELVDQCNAVSACSPGIVRRHQGEANKTLPN